VLENIDQRAKYNTVRTLSAMVRLRIGKGVEGKK
jgi:hypothetical protein